MQETGLVGTYPIKNMNCLMSMSHLAYKKITAKCMIMNQAIIFAI